MHSAQDMFSAKHFAELQTEVQAELAKYGYFQRHGWAIATFVLKAILFVASFYVFALPGLIFKVVGIILLGYFYFAIALPGIHETRHTAFAKSPFWNRAWAYFFSDFWGNQSNDWWYHRHVLEHHAYTNVPDRDPPSFTYPWINRWSYFFAVPYALGGWLFYYSLVFLKKKPLRLLLFVLLSIAGWAFHIWMFSLVVSMPYAVLCFFIMRLLWSPVFMHMAVFNHIGLETPETRLPWLPHQTMTTRNLKPNLLLIGMGGHAFTDFHIEHHLFPRMSDHMTTKIAPIVKKYVAKEGYKYSEQSYMSCLKNCLKYYKELFKYGPPDPIELL